ncbi:MAG: hypothetical protein HRT77_00445 [Halioglobus sp.]|nr:hypothetical protein [Halioglobus sp.]
METWITDSVGMLGTLLVVLAYFLLQLEKVKAGSLSYNLINLIGACCLLFSLCFTFNLASFVIELFWIAASLIGLWKYLKRHASKDQAPN